MAVIFVVSSQPAPELATEPLLDLILKKLAHAAAYAILAVLVAFALSDRWPPVPSWLAFVITVGYAIADEIHQAFVPTRHSAPLDVLIDAVGAAIGLLALAGIHRRMRSRRAE